MIVVGIGNPYRGDDGAGWAVIEALEKITDFKNLVKSRADVGVLLEIFRRWPTVYLVDACLTNEPSGSWRRIDALKEPIPPERAQTSTHGFSLSQIIEMATTLHQLPSQLIIYAISGRDYQMRDRLSLPVEQAVRQVAQEIQACMKNTSSTI